MSSDQEIQAFDALLKAFGQVPERPERLPTFLEITRYPHYEDVCSNILAFFFDPKNPHGLGTLFLDAIALIGCIEEHQGMSDNVEVTREEYTKNGKRIDILIRSNTHAILIENKILQPSDNPFRDYAEHIKCMPKCHKYKHKLLLTLKPDEGGTAQQCGFANITHEQLVKKIRELLGTCVAGADTRYLTLMLDFLNTLDNLREGMIMNPEFFEFVKSHQDDVERLLGRVREFRRELRAKIEELGEMINYNHLEVSQWKYAGDRAGEQDGLWDILVHEIAFADFKVAIDAWVRPKGWKIEVFIRGDGAKARLAELLSKLKIPYEEKNMRFVVHTCAEYGSELKDIARPLQDVVSKLAEARSSNL